MRYQRKLIVKEDGRSLIFYHFEKTASSSQVTAFNSVATGVEVRGGTVEADQSAASEIGEGTKDV